MRKLKIVQLESFYSNFLQVHYQRYSNLPAESFLDQTNSLLNSGYSGGHNVVPFLDPSRWQPHYIIPNCPWTQAAWARENGLDPGSISPSDLLGMQLERIDPDVLYLSDLPGFDFSILKRLKRRPFIVGWHATIVDERIQWKEIDLLLSGISGIRQRAVELGARAAACYMPSAPPYKCPQTQDKSSGNVVFSGSFSGGIHDARAEQYRVLARNPAIGSIDIYTAVPFAVSGDENLRFFPPVYGNDVLELYSRYRIVLDSRGDFRLGETGKVRESSNMRIFEATRAGSFLITEASGNLGDYFSVGEEIETYQSTEELIDKVAFYCNPANESIRARISAAGFRRTMREHLIEHRALWFERLVLEHAQLSPGISSAPAIRPNSIKYPHLLCTRVKMDDLIFGLACIDNLIERFPGAPLVVLCEDAGSFDLLTKLKLDVQLLSQQEIELWERQSGKAVDAAATAQPDSRKRLLRYLLHCYTKAARLTYVDPSMRIGDASLLDAGKKKKSVLLFHYRFGEDYRHAEEALGPRSLDIFSIPGGQAGMDLLEHLIQARAGAQQVAAIAAQAGFSVCDLPGSGPWNYGIAHDPGTAKGTDTPGLFHFFLLRRKIAATWEYLSFTEQRTWPDCYRQVYVPYLQQVEKLVSRHLPGVELGEQSLATTDSRLSTYMLRRAHLAQHGYRLLTAAEYSAFRNEALGWDSPSVAKIQHQAFKTLMSEYESGQRRVDLRALVGILSRTLKPEMTILEEGCGSGYNSEFIRRTVTENIRYTGIDLAPAMISLAKEVYPDSGFEVMGSERLGFADGSFDIVLNGASLMHTVDFDQAIAEARRVARRYVILHTVTVCGAQDNIYFEKIAYGSKVVEVCFSADRLNELLQRHNLLPVIIEDSIEYNLSGIVGVPTKSVSLACYCLDRSLPEKVTPEDCNYYCTYFDSNYLPRGIAMMRSLTRHDPRAHFFVLCLDDITEEYIRNYAPNVKAIRLQALLDADPEFAASRNNRSLVEWYFTATSAFVNYLLTRYPTLHHLTYLDSDLYFYSYPALLHEEAKNASVQVIEHRFSQHLAGLEVYGRFNVGWIGFTNSPEGRQVVEEYRANCIEWCYDRLEDDRFGDQKYLDRWPARYPNCCVSQVKGANVGPWNLGRWNVQRFGSDLFIDTDRLVFYHFQGIKRTGPGQYATASEPSSFGAYYEEFYAPYMRELADIDRELTPFLEKAQMREIRYPNR